MNQADVNYWLNQSAAMEENKYQKVLANIEAIDSAVSEASCRHFDQLAESVTEDDMREMLVEIASWADASKVKALCSAFNQRRAEGAENHVGGLILNMMRDAMGSLAERRAEDEVSK